MSKIQVYLLQNSAPAYTRGLIAKSASGRHGLAVDGQAHLASSDLLRELDTFIAARHLQKSKVRLSFGRTMHSPEMQALVDQIED